MNFKHPDLHLHSSVSDGSDTPLELLEKVRASDIDIFSLTDHDTYLGCEMIARNLREGDPAFVGGIELSCRDKLGKYHILGYGYNIRKQSIRAAADITHNARREKALNRIAFLEDVHHFVFSEEEINNLLQMENPGKPHFVELLLKHGYVPDKAAGFALMSEYRGKERRLTPDEAIDAILRSDGIPVLAHGILGDGSDSLTREEIDSRVERLKGFGLMGLECFYSSYTQEQTGIMLSLAEKYNLMVTAGSDYHGSRKPVPLGASGNADARVMERFYRACGLLLGT